MPGAVSHAVYDDLLPGVLEENVDRKTERADIARLDMDDKVFPDLDRWQNFKPSKPEF